MNHVLSGYPRHFLDPLFTVAEEGAKFLWNNKEQIPYWLSGGAWAYNTAKAVKNSEYIPDPNYWLRQQARYSGKPTWRSPWAYRYRATHQRPYFRSIRPTYKTLWSPSTIRFKPRSKRRYRYSRRRRYNKIDRLADLIDTI